MPSNLTKSFSKDWEFDFSEGPYLFKVNNKGTIATSTEVFLVFIVDLELLYLLLTWNKYLHMRMVDKNILKKRTNRTKTC